MKLNNKGFAVSIILYSMIAVITIVLVLIVTIYTTNVHNKLSQADSVKQKISGLQNLPNRILNDNNVLNVAITLTSTAQRDTPGLYKSIATTSGQPTYYFRGNVTNSYIKFANKMWRIVRINEDKTVRLILDTRIDSNTYIYYNADSDNIKGMYYSKTETSGIKKTLDTWYENNLKNGYGSKIAIGNYFCEQNKVADSTYTPPTTEVERYKSNPVLKNNYTYPDFKCSKDGNEDCEGLVNSAIGLLTYDEVVFSGLHHTTSNTTYSYLYRGGSGNNAYNWYTMSPNNPGSVWYVINGNQLATSTISNSSAYIRPVINLRSNVVVTGGNGTYSSPYEVN